MFNEFLVYTFSIWYLFMVKSEILDPEEDNDKGYAFPDYEVQNFFVKMISGLMIFYTGVNVVILLVT